MNIEYPKTPLIDIKKIKEIVDNHDLNDDDKRLLIINEFAKDESIMINLLEIARIQHSTNLSLINSANQKMTDSLFYLTQKCMCKSEKQGISKNYVIDNIKNFYRNFKHKVTCLDDIDLNPTNANK